MSRTLKDEFQHYGRLDMKSLQVTVFHVDFTTLDIEMGRGVPIPPGGTVVVAPGVIM